MSDKELNRVNVIQAVCEKRLRRRDAAAQIVNRSPSGLAHGLRGKPGNHFLPGSFKLHVLALVRQYYSDFGPILAAEKLRELIRFSKRIRIKCLSAVSERPDLTNQACSSCCSW